MYNCKQCTADIDLTNTGIYSDDGDEFTCPSCNTVHTQEDIIAPPQNYSCPKPIQMSEFIDESFPSMGPVNEMDSIYGVFTDMFKVLVGRVATLEAKVSELTREDNNN